MALLFYYLKKYEYKLREEREGVNDVAIIL